eukprot:5943805-Heterocapsa_arctica.AAC.1
MGPTARTASGRSSSSRRRKENAPRVTTWWPSARPRTTAGLATGGRALAAAKTAPLTSTRPEA